MIQTSRDAAVNSAFLDFRTIISTLLLGSFWVALFTGFRYLGGFMSSGVTVLFHRETQLHHVRSWPRAQEEVKTGRTDCANEQMSK